MPTTSRDTKPHVSAHGIDAFKHYFVGINSLDKFATREDRVCVLNILGGESRTVTPIASAIAESSESVARFRMNS